MVTRPCLITECGRPVLARGWCQKHYCRWQRHGDPLYIDKHFYGSTEERFWHYVRKQPDGHWMWNGPVNSTKPGRDYGRLFDSDTGRSVLAHRYSFELHKGPIPNGKEPDHTCRIPRCVCPDHLEDVTHRTNVRRGESPAAKHARKEHCGCGRPYDITIVTKNRRRRACSECRNRHGREWYAANRGTGMGTGSHQRAKTHCPKGHPYSGVNLYVPPGRPAGRGCKECRRTAKRKG